MPNNCRTTITALTLSSHAVVGLLLLAAIPHVMGQVNTGDVIGTVTDVSGAVTARR